MNMDLTDLYQKALGFHFLTLEEGVFLFKNAPLTELMFVADELRKKQVPHEKVTWQIDRNVNTTNVCIANCKFCDFYRVPGHPEAYITDMSTYRKKISETLRYGGDQLLLQGGHHPELGLDFYINTFRQIKREFPSLKLHALGPPEVAHITKLEKSTHREVLLALKQAGLDSLPGAGAEILVDRVRRLNAKGFLAFIAWTFQDVDTLLVKIRGVQNLVTPEEYIRMVAVSRIMLPNIKNIQASWLTVGKQTAQVCLHAGANDFGSIMIEENVVSAAGAPHRFTAKGIQKAINEAGFPAQLRNQQYEFRKMPELMEEQVITY